MPEREPFVRITDVTKYTLTDAEVREAIMYWMINSQHIHVGSAKRLSVDSDHVGFTVVTAEWQTEEMTLGEYNKRKKGDAEDS